MSYSTPLLFSFLLVLAALERVPRLRFEKLALLRPFAKTDWLCFATGAVALGLAVRALFATLAAEAGALLPALSALPFVPVTLLAVVAYDSCSYLVHYALHRFELGWRLHKVHHSSRKLDWLAAFRAHVLEHAARHVSSAGLLLLLGFPLGSVALAGAVYAGFGAFNHANLRLKLLFLEPIFITPRLHRLHHVDVTTSQNLGTIFSLWDRLRGTLVTSPAAALEPLGVPGEQRSFPQTYFAQLIEPFRSEREVRGGARSYEQR